MNSTQQRYLKITGITLVPLLIVTGYLSAKNRKQNRLASALLKALQTKLHPTTLGLDSELGFDAGFAEKVLSSVSGRVLVLKKEIAAQYAKQIHEAFAPWYLGGDDEDMIYGVLRNLKDKVQVSQVAKAYQDDYGINLKEQLKNRFDKEEIKKVLRIVNPLPKYRLQ